jgi:spermidine synthase
MSQRAIYAIIYSVFAISGLSGLIYQVVWVRFIGRVFGNTLESVSLVTAVFMLGLGVGSYAAGVWVDRRASGGAILPVRAYAYAEVGIGILGFGLALLLPALEPFSALISGYESGPGWMALSVSSYAARFLVAVILLGPSTLLMGATLTLLIRYLLSFDVTLSGWRIGLLYGVNTVGAAAGAFLTDYLLVPGLGLFSTAMFAVVGNLVAAALAMRVVNTPSDVIREPTPSAPDRLPAAWLRGTVAAILLSGFAAMGVEIVWFRFLSHVLGGFRAVFSILLAVILVGIALGSILGGLCHRRFGRPVGTYMIAQAGFVVFTLGLILSYDKALVVGLWEWHADTYAAGGSLARWTINTWVNVVVIAGVVGLPAVFMGFAYPLANAHTQTAKASIGRRAGLLYLANTVGAVLGAVVTGFVLVPVMGTKGTLVVLAACAGFSIVALRFARPSPSTPWHLSFAGRSFAVCAVVVVLAISGFSLLPQDILTRHGIPNARSGEKLIHLSEGMYELIAVTEDSDGVRALNTNGHSMSTNGPASQRYMRAFVHLPLLQNEAPKVAVVICFGVGSTLHAASLHPLDRLEVVDISRHVLSQGHHFASTNGGVLERADIEVFVNDGRNHLWMQPEDTYDLITMEPPPIAFAGVSGLYSQDFYYLVKSRLRDEGYFTQWLPAYQVPEDITRSMIRAFIDVFPSAVLLSGHGAEFILVGKKAGPIVFDPDVAAAVARARPDVMADLRRINFGSVTEIVGSFVASPETLAAVTRESAPVTDDWPIMEYGIQSGAYETRLPDDIFGRGGVESFCPKCFRPDGSPSARAPLLSEYLAVLLGLYRSDAFLVTRNHGGGQEVPAYVDLPKGITPDSEVVRRHGYLRSVLGAPR